MKTYFHELTKERYESLFQEKITFGELIERFKQPDWCSYPDALAGPMGCWSLVGGLVSGKDYCKGCECCD